MKNFLILTILISGLVFTSIIKNKTRALEKEILYLDSEIDILKSKLAEATLEFEYLITPENISLLAKNYLDEDFTYYHKSQIIKFGDPIKKIEKKIYKTNKIDRRVSNLKFEIGMSNLEKPEEKNDYKKLEEKRLAAKNSYHPKTIDSEKIYNSKKSLFKSEKVQRWAGFQIIKAMLGIPIVPMK
tara:strand:+ start:51 stop:605 length:555 start_codon:yes stop_codon:yes gene_type:complete